MIPEEIKAATGMIIQAQRDSLDYVVHSLAVKNGAKKLNTVQFPVAESQAGLPLQRIAELDPADQAAIIALNPYKGGNNDLYALHWLSNKSKHRELITVAQNLKQAGWRAIPGKG